MGSSVTIDGLAYDESELLEALERLLGHPPHRASPAFGIAGIQAGAHEPLSLRWEDGHAFVTVDGESMLSVWACKAMVGGVVRQRLPGDAPPAQGPEPMINIFKGAGGLTLTDRRLIGSMDVGNSVFGELGPSDDRAVVFAIDLGDIVEITLHRRKGALGVKDSGVFLVLATGGTLLADFDSVVGDGRRALRGSKREAAETIAGAVFAVRAEGASPEELSLLNRAVHGEWESDGVDLVAKLRPLDDVSPEP